MSQSCDKISPTELGSVDNVLHNSLAILLMMGCPLSCQGSLVRKGKQIAMVRDSWFIDDQKVVFARTFKIRSAVLYN